MASVGEKQRSDGHEMTREGKSNTPRPLDDAERELIEALLGAVRTGARRYLGQLESVEVVGSCRCGCPSIDLRVASKPSDGRATPLILADAESPGGEPVGVILWVRGGSLSGLEVHPWNGTARVRLPRPDSLMNFRK